MKDKNEIELKTGQIVKIENGFFKCDNGLYVIERSPGDENWCGKYYSLRKLNKNNTISKSKYNLSSWPLACYINDREKRNLAMNHNSKFATIKVIHLAYYPIEQKRVSNDKL